MTAEEIRKIDLVSYLSKCGIEPKRNGGKYAFYLSPFTQEHKPSFAVNKAKNTFNDYSSGNRGSIIDFVMAYEKLDFKQACEFLGGDSFSDIEQYTPKKDIADGVKIHSVSEITNNELIDYFLGVRKISKEVLLKYCKQVEFSFPYSEKDNTRIYTAIGFKSDLGGYELRSSWMRVCAGAKSFSTIKGKSKNKVIIIEGFVDFLSYMTYYELDIPEYTTYVLNGAGQFGVLKRFIGDKPVLYYGDNDELGNKIANEITNLVDMRHVYIMYKDFNELLQDC